MPGIRIDGQTPEAAEQGAERAWAWLRDHGLAGDVDGPPPRPGRGTPGRRLGGAGDRRFRLNPAARDRWLPERDTTGAAQRIGLDPGGRATDLAREIVVAWLAAPEPLDFPSFEEFESALRIRLDTVHATRRTALAFDCESIERPTDCWHYTEDTGFVVRPGHDLREALRKATQPPAGTRYAFSCYRASEYLMLLAIAEEAARSHDDLFTRLQAQAEQRAIQSGEFHDVFLREFGTLEAPLPARWYVPGDRIWFRNPDERSASVQGYEGSWTIYLGGGEFSNFWDPTRPFDLTRKCLEVYHWRHAVHTTADGRPAIDEAEVERRIGATLADPAALSAVLQCMHRPRAPRHVWDAGGCIDATREFVRWIRPGTCDIALPDR